MGVPTTKRKVVRPNGGKTVLQFTGGQPTTTYQTWLNTNIESSSIVTRSNPWHAYQRLLKDLPDNLNPVLRWQDVGSGFTLDRMTRHSNYEDHSFTNRTAISTTSYSGSMMLAQPDSTIRSRLLAGLYWPSESELNDALFAAGGTAISRSNPGKPVIDLAVSLSELFREGLPKMVGLQSLMNRAPSRVHNNIGSEYLNMEFGWAPIISDLLSLCEIVVKSDDLLTQYRNRFGKNLRRKYRFPDQISTDNISFTSNVTPLGTTHWRVPSHISSTVNGVRTYKQETWFSGSYRQYLASTDFGRFKQEAAHLLGLRVTPEVIWNLTPWTWLSDWFLNIGDVVSNISNTGTDGTPLRYGYIMQHTSVSATLVHRAVPFGGTQPVTETVTLERKARRKASPYGFGLAPGVTTPKQAAILGALALTRLPEDIKLPRKTPRGFYDGF